MNLHLNCCTADQLSAAERQRILELADAHRQADPAFAHWAAGYGVIRHDPLTQLRVRQMVHELVALGRTPDAGTAWQRLAAADRITSAGMWLVAHMTYSQRVRTDGAALEVDDFKTTPEGHTGGSLNMVPAYAGYLLMDSLDGVTRAWMMGHGHCVAAIDALNVLVGNMTDRHAERYDRTGEGLSRFVSDFYDYTLNPDGTPASPLGSHVNAHTAGGGKFLGILQVKKRQPSDEGRQGQAALIALATYSELKNIILVDEDVDIFDSYDILWAMTTRMQGDVSITNIPGIRGHQLDPSQSPDYSTSIRANGISCKTIFDCTVPWALKDRFERAPFMEVDPRPWAPELFADKK